MEILPKLLERLPTNQWSIWLEFLEKRRKDSRKWLIASSVVDNAKFQYDQFMTKEVVITQKFLKFNFKTGRLASFLYQFVAINVDYLGL